MPGPASSERNHGPQNHKSKPKKRKRHAGAARNEAQAAAIAHVRNGSAPHDNSAAYIANISGAAEILGRAARNLENIKTKAQTAERAKQLGLSGYGTDSDHEEVEHTQKRARRGQQGSAMRAVKADIFHQNRVAQMQARAEKKALKAAQAESVADPAQPELGTQSPTTTPTQTSIYNSSHATGSTSTAQGKSDGTARMLTPQASTTSASTLPAIENGSTSEAATLPPPTVSTKVSKEIATEAELADNGANSNARNSLHNSHEPQPESPTNGSDVVGKVASQTSNETTRVHSLECSNSSDADEPTQSTIKQAKVQHRLPDDIINASDYRDFALASGDSELKRTVLLFLGLYQDKSDDLTATCEMNQAALIMTAGSREICNLRSISASICRPHSFDADAFRTKVTWFKDKTIKVFLVPMIWRGRWLLIRMCRSPKTCWYYAPKSNPGDELFEDCQSVIANWLKINEDNVGTGWAHHLMPCPQEDAPACSVLYMILYIDLIVNKISMRNTVVSSQMLRLRYASLFLDRHDSRLDDSRETLELRSLVQKYARTNASQIDDVKSVFDSIYDAAISASSSRKSSSQAVPEPAKPVPPQVEAATSSVPQYDEEPGSDVFESPAPASDEPHRIFEGHTATKSRQPSETPQPEDQVPMAAGPLIVTATRRTMSEDAESVSSRISSRRDTIVSMRRPFASFPSDSQIAAPDTYQDDFYGMPSSSMPPPERPAHESHAFKSSKHHLPSKSGHRSSKADYDEMQRMPRLPPATSPGSFGSPTTMLHSSDPFNLPASHQPGTIADSQTSMQVQQSGNAARALSEIHKAMAKPKNGIPYPHIEQPPTFMLEGARSTIPREIEEIMRAAPICADLTVSRRSPGTTNCTKEQSKLANARNLAVAKDINETFGLDIDVGIMECIHFGSKRASSMIPLVGAFSGRKEYAQFATTWTKHPIGKTLKLNGKGSEFLSIRPGGFVDLWHSTRGWRTIMVIENEIDRPFNKDLCVVSKSKKSSLLVFTLLDLATLLLGGEGSARAREFATQLVDANDSRQALTKNGTRGRNGDRDVQLARALQGKLACMQCEWKTFNSQSGMIAYERHFIDCHARDAHVVEEDKLHLCQFPGCGKKVGPNPKCIKAHYKYHLEKVGAFSWYKQQVPKGMTKRDILDRDFKYVCKETECINSSWRYHKTKAGLRFHTQFSHAAAWDDYLEQKVPELGVDGFDPIIRNTGRIEELDEEYDILREANIFDVDAPLLEENDQEDETMKPPSWVGRGDELESSDSDEEFQSLSESEEEVRSHQTRARTRTQKSKSRGLTLSKDREHEHHEEEDASESTDSERLFVPSNATKKTARKRGR